MVEEKHTKGGKQARVGSKFFEAIENIKDKKLLNGTTKERMSTERISNMIAKHKLWPTISEHIIIASEEEIDKHGK